MFRFFVLACALSWLAWAPLTASALGWTDATPSPYLHLLGGLGPAAAGLIVSARGGREGVARVIRRTIAAPPRWIVLGVALPVTLYLVAAVVLMVVGYDVDLSATGRSREYPALGVGWYALANIVCYGFGEEIGWRGYALPRLQTHRTATRATLYLALGWAIWHLPLFAFSAGMSAMRPAEMLGWAVSILAGAFLMTFVFNASAGSVLVVALFHGTLDILISSPTGGPLQITMGALVTVAGLTLPFRFGHRDLAPRPRVRDGSHPRDARVDPTRPRYCERDATMTRGPPEYAPTAGDAEPSRSWRALRRAAGRAFRRGRRT